MDRFVPAERWSASEPTTAGRSRARPTGCNSTGSFGFDQAAALAPYLAELGISHVYCSPYLKARPGSTHGYDLVNHNALNPELGSPDRFRRDGRRV